MPRMRAYRVDPRRRVLDTFTMTEQRPGPWTRPHATTILGVVRPDGVALAGDGQVTFGEYVIKQRARKIRLLKDGTTIAGFAGAVADALTLIEKFEGQLKAWDGNMRKAAVELAKEWRTDRYLRRLEAQLLIANIDSLLLISGDGDVIEPDDGVVAIGAGAPYATAAAKALLANTDLTAREIVEAAMAITANMCIFTNDHFTVEVVRRDESVARPPVADDVAMGDITQAAVPSSADDDEDDDDDDAEEVEGEEDVDELEDDDDKDGEDWDE